MAQPSRDLHADIPELGDDDGIEALDDDFDLDAQLDAHFSEVQALAEPQPTRASASMPLQQSAHDALFDRVRFCTPAILRPDGEGQGWEATTANLSPHGVACVSAVLLQQGDRAWVDFRLSLGEDPMSLGCEVVWARHAGEHGNASYGLRFLDPTPDEAIRIQAAVRERAEGRAGEWPMPMIPDLRGEAQRAGTRPNPWVIGAAGMAAGIGLALLLAVVTGGMPTAPTATAPSLQSAQAGDATGASATPAVDVTVAVAPGVVVASADSADDVEGAGDFAQVAGPAVTTGGTTVIGEPARPAPVVPTVASVTPSTATANASTNTSSAASAPAPTPETATAPAPAAAAGSHAVPAAAHASLLTINDGAGGSATVVLPLDGPAASHSSFWLEKPTRLVVDIAGRHASAALAKNKIQRFEHPLVRQIRVGQHADKVRFVIETGAAAARKVSARPEGNALHIRLQRR